MRPERGLSVTWLAMQDAHDLWVAEQHLDLSGVSKLELAEA